MVSILHDVLLAIQSAIQGRQLPGLSAGNVVVQKVAAHRSPDLPMVDLPCILISPHGAETTDPLAGTNLRDDIVYPVRVTILAADAGDQQFGFRQYLGWREAIRRLFHNQRLATTGCFTVHVQPLPIVDAGVWTERHLFSSAVVLNCFSRESRG
jgi:hypothetical protein